MIEAREDAVLGFLRENVASRGGGRKQPRVIHVNPDRPARPGQPLRRVKLVDLRGQHHTESSPTEPGPRSKFGSAAVDSDSRRVRVPRRPERSTNEPRPHALPRGRNIDLVPNVNGSAVGPEPLRPIDHGNSPRPPENEGRPPCDTSAGVSRLVLPQAVRLKGASCDQALDSWSDGPTRFPLGT